MKPIGHVCAVCGQVVPFSAETPDNALVVLGRPSRFAGVLDRLWRRLRG